MNFQHVRCSDDACDRRNVRLEVKAQLLVKRRVDGVGSTCLEKRISIGGRTHDRLCAEVAICARPVLDDELLPKALREPLSYHTCDNVGRTASRVSNHNAHWPRRVGLRAEDQLVSFYAEEARLILIGSGVDFV